MHIVAVATNKTDDEIKLKFSIDGAIEMDFTDDQWKAIEADLNMHHTSEQVQRTIKMLRGFQIHASTELFESTAVS